MSPDQIIDTSCHSTLTQDDRCRAPDASALSANPSTLSNSHLRALDRSGARSGVMEEKTRVGAVEMSVEEPKRSTKHGRIGSMDKINFVRVLGRN